MKYLTLPALILLGGCSMVEPNVWDKPGGTQAQFNRDFGECKLVAMGAPQQQAPQLAPNYVGTTTYNGTYMGNNNYGTVNGMATTTVQAQPNQYQGLANLGTALGNRARRNHAADYCMEAKGYSLRQN